MSRIAESTIQELNDKLDAIAVAGDYVRLEKRGGQYWGCCPFHNEKTPSFKVDPDKKLYYCFGCHKGGTMIDFVMEMDKLTFVEAVEILAKRTGIEIVRPDTGGNEPDPAINNRKDELFELYKRVAGSFHHLLTEKSQGQAAKGYIISRGISEDMINEFRLGYAPADRSWLFRFLSGKGYSEDFLGSSGLFSPKYPRTTFFSDRLMFPIADRQGRTAAFGARLLSGEGPKYLNSPESDIYKKGQTLFAIDLALPGIRRTHEAYIAEGYMDVIALHQAGIRNAVAPLGTAFTDDQAKLLRRWAERIYLIFDADEAGQTAAVKAILSCRKNGLAASVVIPGRGIPSADSETGPVFKDPADILKEAGAEALQKSVKCFINDFEYLVSRGRSLFDVSGSEGKAKAVAFLFPFLETLDSEVSRDACLEDIADAFGVERSAVQADFNHYHGQNQGPKRGITQNEVPPDQAKPVRMNDELFLLTAVLVNHGLYPKLRSTLSIEELEDPRAKELFIALEEWFRNETPGKQESQDASLPHDLLSRINDGVLRNFIIAQSTSEAFSMNPEQLFQDSVKRVKQKRLERRQAEIVVELRTQKHSETPGSRDGFWDGPRLEDLLAEKVHIDAELRRFKEANE